MNDNTLCNIGICLGVFLVGIEFLDGNYVSSVAALLGIFILFSVKYGWINK